MALHLGDAGQKRKTPCMCSKFENSTPHRRHPQLNPLPLPGAVPLTVGGPGVLPG